MVLNKRKMGLNSFKSVEVLSDPENSAIWAYNYIITVRRYVIVDT